MAKRGRPRTCECGTCKTCKRRAEGIRRRAKWTDRQWAMQRARVNVNNAIRDGRLERGPCEVCGTTPAEGHHDDYDKPLEVRWLCRQHHLEHHKNEKRNAA